MKKILLILATAALSLGSFAGNPDDNKGRKNDPDKYCAELKDGVIKVMHNNEELTADVTLSNGTKIHPDGTVTREGGYSRTLKEGECVNMDGEIETGDLDRSKDFNKDTDEPLKGKKTDKDKKGDMNRSGHMEKKDDMNKDMNKDKNMDKGNMDKENMDKEKKPESSDPYARPK